LPDYFRNLLKIVRFTRCRNPAGYDRVFRQAVLLHSQVFGTVRIQYEHPEKIKRKTVWPQVRYNPHDKHWKKVMIE
jgi:hypothetical protein